MTLLYPRIQHNNFSMRVNDHLQGSYHNDKEYFSERLTYLQESPRPNSADSIKAIYLFGTEHTFRFPVAIREIQIASIMTLLQNQYFSIKNIPLSRGKLPRYWLFLIQRGLCGPFQPYIFQRKQSWDFDR